VTSAVRFARSRRRLLEVERASVWQLVDDGAAIECIDLYERSPGYRDSLGKIDV
jgi:hypothetical protein